MFANDALYWKPQSLNQAAEYACGSTRGDFQLLQERTQATWIQLNQDVLARLNPEISWDKVVEFGPGLGLLDAFIDEKCRELLMLDGSDAFIRQRISPLSSRTTFKSFNQETVDEILLKQKSYFDVAFSLNVFYHVDTLTAIAIIRFLQAIVKRNGYIVIQGYNVNNVANAQSVGISHLFSVYPFYLVDPLVLQKALYPECVEVFRTDGVLIYRVMS